MAIRRILESPIRACARSPSRSRPSTRTLKTLVADMFETMYEAPGIGLAAIQVGVPIRLLVIDLQEPEEEDGEPVKNPRVFINPEILWHSDRTCPTTRAACRCPSNMPRSIAPTGSRRAGRTSTARSYEEEIDGPARDLPAARDGPSERRAVHRPPLAPEARHDPQEARQVAERAAEERPNDPPRPAQG